MSGNSGDLEHLLSEVNGVLTSEANRLGVPMTTELPDPASTAAALSTMAGNAAGAMMDPTSPWAREVGSVQGMASNIREQAIQDAYRMEQDAREMLPNDVFENPEAAIADAVNALNDVKNGIAGGEADRELNEVS